jgi:hypothetical protein
VNNGPPSRRETREADDPITEIALMTVKKAEHCDEKKPPCNVKRFPPFFLSPHQTSEALATCDYR